MSYLAERMSRIDASGIRKVFALAAQMKNPINLSIGQPDYDVDPESKEAAIQAIREGFNSYTQTWGIPELREACSAYYQHTFGMPLKNVIITAGVSGALHLALTAVVNPGDEVIFADPYFVMYRHLVRLLGGIPVPVNTYPDFRLDSEAVEAVITEKTKVLIINSPSNPTGVVLTKDELRSLATVAEKHGLLIISDEIYEGLTFDTERATMAGMLDNVLILNGFSKLAAMTGWRLGYAAGPEDIIQAMNTLQQYTYVCAPSIAQKAGVCALELDHSAKRETYRHKRDLAVSALRDAGFSFTVPGGAFYVFIEAPGGDGDAFVQRSIENNVLIIPGSVFSDQKTHFRLSYAAPDETLRKGIETLAAIKKEYVSG